jgi:hypothetical protein
MIFKIRRNDEDIGNRKRGGAIQTPLWRLPPPSQYGKYPPK